MTVLAPGECVEHRRSETSQVLVVEAWRGGTVWAESVDDRARAGGVRRTPATPSLLAAHARRRPVLPSISCSARHHRQLHRLARLTSDAEPAGRPCSPATGTAFDQLFRPSSPPATPAHIQRIALQKNKRATAQPGLCAPLGPVARLPVGPSPRRHTANRPAEKQTCHGTARLMRTTWAGSPTPRRTLPSPALPPFPGTVMVVPCAPMPPAPPLPACPPDPPLPPSPALPPFPGTVMVVPCAPMPPAPPLPACPPDPRGWRQVGGRGCQIGGWRQFGGSCREGFTQRRGHRRGAGGARSADAGARSAGGASSAGAAGRGSPSGAGTG